MAFLFNNENMLTRGHLWIGLTAVLRLPAFFILEKWFLSTPGDVWYEMLASAIGLVLAISLTCLRQDHLFELYRNILALLLLTIAYFYSQRILDDTISSENKINAIALFGTFLATNILGLLANYISRGTEFKVFMTFSLPVILTCEYLRLSGSVIQYVQCFSDGLLYCFLVYHTLRVLISAVNNLVREIKTTSVMNIFGVYLDVKSLVDSLYVQQQLMLFWLTSFSYNALYYATQTAETNLFQVDWGTILSLCVSNSCKTYVGLIATSVAAVYASCFMRSLLIFVITDVITDVL